MNVANYRLYLFLKSKSERSNIVIDFELKNFLSGLWGENYDWVKWVHRNLSENHCSECLRLDGCFFKAEKHPPHPHHPSCHCILENISQSKVKANASAYAAYQKFDPYLFNTKGKEKHNKEKLFYSWGYDVNDSNYLKKQIEKQGLEKYLSGDYKLGVLNNYGQRISIRIEIPNKITNENVSFIVGFMVYPNGKLKLTTPYGGK